MTVILTVLTAISRWFRAELPAGADTAIHLLRAVELDWAVRHNYLYPRWSPDLVFGYGYPLFNVYGPLAQYLIAALHALGLNFITATLGSFVFADVLGALGAFTLGREVFGDMPGLVAAVAYAYAPYTLGSLYRGSPAEALALGLLPWLLWAFYRLHHTPAYAPRRFALAAALYAVFPLLHNPSTVLASGLLAVFLAGLTWARRREKAAPAPRSAFDLSWLAICLGVMLSAFYWLPAVFESRYIQIARAYAPDVLNYHFNFLSLRELFALPQPYDPKLIGVPAPRSLGLPQMLVAFAGVAGWRRRPTGQKTLLGLSAAGVIVLGYLTLPQSVWVWDHLPGLSLIQFPARLLGPASLLLALLAGAAFSHTPGPARPTLENPAGSQNFLPWLAIAAIILFNLTWTFHHTDPLIPAEPTLADIHAFEQRTGSIGTTTAGEYLPIWVKEAPPADALQARYAADPVINRLDPASLPPGAQVVSQTPGLVAQTVELASPVDFTAVFDVFYFPGWQARVDGAPAPIRISAPYGLITVPLKAGAHTVRIYFGATPARVAGDLLALVGLGILIAVMVKGLRGWNGSDVRPKANSLSPLPPLKSIGLVALALFVFKIAVVDRRETIFARTRFDGERVAGAQTPLVVDFGGQMELLGYDLSQASAPSGGPLDVTLYWRVLQPLAKDYSVFLALVDAAGWRFAQSDAQHPAGFPTSRWTPDLYGQDPHTLILLPGTPPGTYRLVANVYHYPDLTALTAGVVIGEVTVTRPRRAIDLHPDHPLQARFGPLELLGADVGLSRVGVGTDLPLTLFWKVAVPPDENLSARVALVNPDGGVAVQQDLAPVRPDYPTSRWTPGETLRAPTSLPIPADLAGGDYSVTLTVVGAQGALAAPVTLGHVQVIEPERTFIVPPVPHLARARFGDFAELVGWGLDQNRLTLYWRALGTARTSYTVFVHVLDPDGVMISQRDLPPVGGARPTTSWLAGEVLTDEYTLDALPDEFTIRVGLYDQASGERIKLANGEDHFILAP
ncbi:MAG: glycosyltransferase family 39 protein [Chloroflexi bacterium]|nr:glycosyltransferase family 39 protein [Chloroflexota bacterium]